MLLLLGTEARAGEPVVTYPTEPPSDVELAAEADAQAAWKTHREGAHLFVQAGFGGLYAPDMGAFFYRGGPREEGGYIESSDHEIVGPTGDVRLGANFGVSRGVDIRVGGGALLGGALLTYDNQFFAYPHALTQLSFGPGDIYRARVGLMVGALLFELDDVRKAPATAYFAVHGEVSPLVLNLGDHGEWELSVTHGLGAFVGDQMRSVAYAIGEVPRAATSLGASFGGHTLVAAAAVVD